MGAGLVVIGAGLAHAQWTDAQRSEFTKDCLPACQKKVPARQNQCPVYCECTVKDFEAAFPDYAALAKGFNDPQSAIRRAAQGLVDACNRRAFP
jgi:hypothetical protein